MGEAVTVYTVVGKERLNHMEGWREKRPANVLLTERERDQLFSLTLAGCSVLLPAPPPLATGRGIHLKR